eukprot:1394286-Amorphochlora_amoeboformis.AAC.2
MPLLLGLGCAANEGTERRLHCCTRAPPWYLEYVLAATMTLSSGRMGYPLIARRKERDEPREWMLFILVAAIGLFSGFRTSAQRLQRLGEEIRPKPLPIPGGGGKRAREGYPLECISGTQKGNLILRPQDPEWGPTVQREGHPTKRVCASRAIGMRIKAEIDKYRAEARLRKRGFISSSRRRDLILLLSGLVAAAFTLSILVMVSYTLLDTEVETHRLGAKLWGGSKNRFDSGRAGRRTPSRRDTPPGPERKWDIDVSEGGRSSSMWSSDRFKGSRERLRGNDWDGYFPYAQGGPWYRELGVRRKDVQAEEAHASAHPPVVVWRRLGGSNDAISLPQGRARVLEFPVATKMPLQAYSEFSQEIHTASL